MNFLVNIVIPPLPKPLTYRLPVELVGKIALGHKVTVPLGKRFTTGYVLSIESEKQNVEDPSLLEKDLFGGIVKSSSKKFEIKELNSATYFEPCFNQELLQFCEWIASYYSEPLSTVIECAIPTFVPPKHERFIQIKEGAPLDHIKGKVQSELLKFLSEENRPVAVSELKTRWKSIDGAIRALSDKDIITVSKEDTFHKREKNPLAPEWANKEVSLTESQHLAVEDIFERVLKKEFYPNLLLGITGSGKTEVYIELIKKTLALGKGVLVIVPEISLTPQLIDRFTARLPGEIAVLHSGLQDRARWESWRALLREESMIAVGARSALFAPVKDLGLIIVDEEHDGSYKQGDGFRYHARDLAIARAKLLSCPIVLGSATPSLETFQHANKKRFKTHILSTRPDAAKLPAIEVVDLSLIKPWNMPSPNVSQPLLIELQRVLENNEQAFVLYNRRGFANYMQCTRCETTLTCPDCSVTLTFHSQNNSLVCHYCNYTTGKPAQCPTCIEKGMASPDAEKSSLVQRGAGTEKVFDEIQQHFPNARIARLDRDVLTTIKSIEEVIDKVRAHEIDFLVGTQMIAKGHDLPNVTLAAVVDCDVGLHMPDFRASERIFQLLTQLAGRAGRGAKAGKVILQTRSPLHPSLLFSSKHDFINFAKHEINQRRDLNYPPFSRLLRVVSSSVHQEFAQQGLNKVRALIEKAFKETGEEFSILGPAPAPIERIKKEWRYHLLIKSPNIAPLLKINAFLKNSTAKNSAGTKFKLIFDLDPQDML